jgi:hypothetical protein
MKRILIIFSLITILTFTSGISSGESGDIGSRHQPCQTSNTLISIAPQWEISSPLGEDNLEVIHIHSIQFEQSTQIDSKTFKDVKDFQDFQDFQDLNTFKTSNTFKTFKPFNPPKHGII